MAAETLLTGQEVADRLRVSVNTLYRLANDGEIDSIRVGKLRRFTREAVEDYLHRGREVPSPLRAAADGAA